MFISFSAWSFIRRVLPKHPRVLALADGFFPRAWVRGCLYNKLEKLLKIIKGEFKDFLQLTLNEIVVDLVGNYRDLTLSESDARLLY